jgi:PAS domain S-box-containing protein
LGQRVSAASGAGAPRRPRLSSPLHPIVPAGAPGRRNPPTATPQQPSVAPGARAAAAVQPASLAELLDVFADAPSGVALIGAHGRFVHVNAALARILGRTTEELLKLYWRDVVHPYDVLACRTGVARALAATGRCEAEVRAVRPDGREPSLRLTARLVRGGEGEPSLVVHCNEGSAALAHPQRETQNSHHLLQRVIDHAPNLLWLKDRDGRCRLANRRGAMTLGLEPAEVLGRTVEELFPAEFAERARDEDAQVVAAGGPLTFAREVPLPDGTKRPYVVTKFPISGSDGEPDGVGLVASDVSEIRRGEADRARLAAMLQAAPDAIVTSDHDGTITSWDAGAEGMLGVPAQDAVGRRYEELVVPEDERGVYREQHERALEGETATVRMGAMRRDGSAFPAEVSFAPLVAPDGSHAGAVVIVRDITEQIEAEVELQERAAELERSNADLEGFAYAASHDLQEPLRSIKLGAETVMRAAGERLHDDERGLLAQVDEAAERMSEQVDALMQVARVALGDAPDEPVPVQLALEDALNALVAAIGEADAEIEVQGELPAAAVPRAEMALVLQNLISNAIKFRRENVRPHVTVSGTARGDDVEVRVADNGIGLSDEDRAHIFAIFSRVQSRVPGTGLGLAVCRRIVERRGGSMSGSSAGRGRGSRFTVRLPARPEARAGDA